MKLFLTSACCLVGFIGDFEASDLYALPVTYTIRGEGTGSLGNVAFTNTPISIFAEADTDDVTDFQSGSSNGFTVTNQRTRFLVEGIGTGEFTSVIRTTSNHVFSRAGFGDFPIGASSFPIVFVDDNIFDTYDLKSTFGPIEGPVALASSRSSPTTQGDFFLSRVNNAEFIAIVVPEPTTFLLSATVVAILLVGRKRLRI